MFSVRRSRAAEAAIDYVNCKLLEVYERKGALAQIVQGHGPASEGGYFPCSFDPHFKIMF